MHIQMAYGRSPITLTLPDDPRLTVLEGVEAPALPHPSEAIARSLQVPIGAAPLAEIAKGRRDACIVISDITRPVPNRLILPPVLAALEAAGIPREKIVILVATGLHRPNVGAELDALVGPDIARIYRCENHFAQDPATIATVGTTQAGIPVELCRHYVAADLKILTGFIEPHMWAGFSGGRKAILPGIASAHTMSFMHGFNMVAHQGCAYGQLVQNPFHEAGMEVARMVGVDFIVNVTLDAHKKVTGVFSGDVETAHRAGCEFLRPQAVVEVERPFDVVITSAGGAPLDVNLYQTVKGITGAADVCALDGRILICSECSEQLGSPEYSELVTSARSPEEFLRRLQQPGFYVVDQWCAQEMFAILRHRPVSVFSSGLDAATLRQCHLDPLTDFQAAVLDLLEQLPGHARVAIIPRGPFTIARVAGAGSSPEG